MKPELQSFERTPKLVWDLPTRVFHALFAAGIVVSAVIALGMGEHSPLFSYHALIGLVLVPLVLLRIVWGFVGTRYARFASFAYGPRAVVAYIRGLMGSRDAEGPRWLGHNPASAWAIFAMLGLFIALAVTGVMMGRGYEAAKEVHEVCAYALAGVAVVHVLGVALHALRRRENLVAGMIHGRKSVFGGALADGITSARPLAAAALVALVAAWGVGLVRGYDPATRTAMVPVVKARLSLGEVEERGNVGGMPGDREEDED